MFKYLYLKQQIIIDLKILVHTKIEMHKIYFRASCRELTINHFKQYNISIKICLTEISITSISN